jgi:hypothetical protein
VYVPSTKRYPTKIREPEYADYFRVEHVGLNGWLHFEDHHVYLSRLLVHERLYFRVLSGNTIGVSRRLSVIEAKPRGVAFAGLRIGAVASRAAA